LFYVDHEECGLTGNRQYVEHTSAFGQPIQVLQVEVKGIINIFRDTGNETKVATWWRPATRSEINQLPN
jgi:hypothetical protein